jgi:hypothetical protein
MGGFMKKLLAVLFCLGLVGCATAPNFNNISMGMTKPEVINGLGKPTNLSAEGNIEYLKYCTLTDIYGNCNPDSAQYFVRLVNSKVESYGKVGDFDSTKNPTNNINLNVNNGSK